MKPANTLALVLLSLGLPLLPTGVALPMAGGEPFGFLALRLAPGQPDAIINVSDPSDNQLLIEMYAGVGNVPSGALVQAYTFFLHTDTNGVIANEGSFNSPLFDLGCFENGVNDAPHTGDLSYACFDLDGVSEGIQLTALYATFSIRALARGQVSYSFVPDGGPVRPSAFSLTDGTVIDGDRLNYVIASNLSVIQVVDVRSDVDGDGDTDMADYAMLQRCTGDLNSELLPAECQLVDLNLDEAINVLDGQAFTGRMTGPDWVTGDLDRDGDADLADFGVLQACMYRPVADEPGCELADVNGDGWTDLADWPVFAHALSDVAN